VANLEEHPLMESKAEGFNTGVDKSFIRALISKFQLMVEAVKFCMGSILQPSFKSTCLRSTCMSIHPRKFHSWQNLRVKPFKKCSTNFKQHLSTKYRLTAICYSFGDSWMVTWTRCRAQKQTVDLPYMSNCTVLYLILIVV
jgi:hypothetical protein